MKKFLATLLACLMLVTVLAGCGQKDPTPAGDEGADKLDVVVVVTDALGGGGTPDDMNNYLKKALNDFDNVNGSIYEARRSPCSATVPCRWLSAGTLHSS